MPWNGLTKVDIDSLSERIATARVVKGRGEGQIIQLPCKLPWSGTVLVLDILGGRGGLMFALLAMGVQFICVHVEQDSDARTVTNKNFPDAVQVAKVQDFDVRCLCKVVARRHIAAILVVGAEPRVKEIPCGSAAWRKGRAHTGL
jgi:hypothetical protein